MIGGARWADQLDLFEPLVLSDSNTKMGVRVTIDSASANRDQAVFETG